MSGLKKNKPILVYDGGFVNKGAEAMLLTVVHELRRRMGSGLRFTILPQHDSPEFRSLAHSYDVLYGEPAPNSRISLNARVSLYSFLLRKSLSTLRQAWPNRLAFHLMLSLSRQISCVVDISGLSYSDAFGPGGLNRAWPLWAAMQSRSERSYSRLFFMPQTWGPFNTFGTDHRAKLLSGLSTSGMLCSRDGVSTKNLVALGIPEERICQTRDIAFAFLPDIGDKTAAMDSQPAARPTAALVPNTRVYQRASGQGAQNSYIRTMSETGESLIRQGFSLVLLPHEVLPNATLGVDDRVLCHLIKGVLLEKGWKSEEVSVPSTFSAADVKSQLSGVSVLVGSRFHALVAALSLCIPVFAIGWQHKYKELLREFGLSEYCLSLQDIRIGRPQIGEKIADWISKQDIIRRQISGILPQIHSDIEALFDDLSTAISPCVD